MSTLDLTKEQKREIVTLRKMLLQKLQQLVEERRQLNMTIQTSLPSSTVGHRIDLEYLKANQAVVRLKEILRSEHNAMLDFVSTIVKKVWIGSVLLAEPTCFWPLCPSVGGGLRVGDLKMLHGCLSLTKEILVGGGTVKRCLNTKLNLPQGIQPFLTRLFLVSAIWFF